MTDRASVNTSIDKKLCDITNNDIHSFRCGIHPLDSFAKACESVLLENHNPEEFPRLYTHRGKSGVHCLIRKTCDLFHNESTGCSQELRSYFQSVKSLPRWVGNRFNILFDSSRFLVSLTPRILNYFRKVCKPSNHHQSVVSQYLPSVHFQNSIFSLAVISS